MLFSLIKKIIKDIPIMQINDVMIINKIGRASCRERVYVLV